VILLASLISRLLTDADATGVLMSYAEHTFRSAKMGPGEGVWIHDETVKHWFSVAKVSSDQVFIENYLRSSRFLFQVIFKVSKRKGKTSCGSKNKKKKKKSSVHGLQDKKVRK
jgi:hypothetical protein